MKKTAIFILILGTTLCHSQNLSEKKDSVRIYKNEIGINLLPLINEYSGGSNSFNSKGSVVYRRFFGKHHALRLSLGFNPSPLAPKNNYAPAFVAKTDTFNIYYNSAFHSSPKPQLNVGYEYILKTKRLIHSFGAELYMSYQHTEAKENYLWAGQSSIIRLPNDITKITANRVDSMSASNSSDVIGLGLQLFYNLRIPITKHWLISTTIGPNFSMSRIRAKNTSYKTGTVASGIITNFDANGIYIADLSVCFRF
jgi:hypothetical protein